MIAKRAPVVTAAAMLLLFFLPVMGAEKEPLAPRVIATQPQTGARDVEPGLGEITATFSEPMMDKSWSWAFEDRGRFPEIAGQAYYTDDFRTCVLPVRLEQGKEYVIWINTGKLKNFKSASGVTAQPYKLIFRTK